MLLERSSGILLHPTSLPSHGGIGDLGPAAYGFIDFLASARQSVWQVLPLNPPGYGDSPYSSISAFAGNPLLISPERLADRGLIDRKQLASLPDGGGHVRFDEVRRARLPLVREAAQTFIRDANGGPRQRFEQFKRDYAWWLEEFALFSVLRQQFGGEQWNRWPAELARRDGAAIARARQQFHAEIEVERVIQFFFVEQWRALRSAANRRGIRIMGDVAIFVNFDSADVWQHRDIFRVGDNLESEAVSGVPPDAFSATGQLWGNPLYRWDALRARGYDWWIQRMRWALEQCDLIRLDHFRGFESYWEIPGHEKTAVNGQWRKGPADELFHALQQALGKLPFVAEDLGMITPEVHALRERLQIPGMRVLQFGFGNRGAHIYLPHRFDRNSVVYTGTHDNDTTVGWWKNGTNEQERRDVRALLGNDPDGVHWALIRAAAASVADVCIFPLQDVLGLDTDCRMNTPSRPQDNWTWRVLPGALTDDMARKLAAIADVTDRDERFRSAAAQQGDGQGGEEFAA
jgi:4-alpha-glucanotransferase